MSHKLAFLLLNPTASTWEKAEENWTFFENFPIFREGKQLAFQTKDLKHFLKELACGCILPPPLEEAKHLLNAKPFLKKIKTHLSTHKSNLHILVSLIQASKLLPLVLKTMQGGGQIFLHLALERSEKELLLSVAKLLENWENKAEYIIASLAGANSIFNQKGEWSETQKVYDEIVFNQSQTSFSLSEYLEKQFEQNTLDEEIAPVSFVSAEPLEANDTFLLLESDAEKIELLSQTLEVSKNETKKTDFPNFNPIFITKSLPQLLLATIKRPYLSYEGLSIIEGRAIKTLAEKIADQEFRQLYLGNPQQLKLLIKYLSNESGILVDGQKMEVCKALISETGELLQTESETLVKNFGKQIKQFEVFFLACDLKENDTNIVEQLISVGEEEKISFLLCDCQKQMIWTDNNLKLKKGEASDLHEAILEYLFKGEKESNFSF